MSTLTHPLQHICGKDHDRPLDVEGTVSIGGRTITVLRFADDLSCLAGEGEELAKLVEFFDKGFTANGMEITAEKATHIQVQNLINRVVFLKYKTSILYLIC